MINSRSKWSDTILIGTSLRDFPIQRHFASLGGELINSGYKVALVVHGLIDKGLTLDPRLEVLNWPSPRPTRFADMLFFDRLVRCMKPCCLISNFGARNIMMTIGGLRHVPVRIHWHHTLSSQIESDWRDSSLKLKLVKLRARVPFGFTTHVIVNSHAGRADLASTFGVPAQKCQVFWNSVADPLVQPTLASISGNSSPNGCRFVCVGRFDPSKGQDVFLKATAKVVSRHPEIEVGLIGDGFTRGACERLARELGLEGKCRFFGRLIHTEVLAKMAGALAVVVPSRNEAFGLVNIEAMSVGVPVIGSNTGGIAEIVRDGVDGFLFPPGDAGALAATMIALLENKLQRAQLAASARRRFLDYFESTQAVKTQARWIIEQINKNLDGAAQLTTTASYPTPT